MKKFLKTAGFILIYIAAYYLILRGTLKVLIAIATANEGFKLWARNNISITVLVNDIAGLLLFVPLIALLKKQNLIKRCNFSKINLKTIVIISIMSLASGIFTGSIFKLPVISERFPDISSLLGVIIDGSTLPIFIAFLVIGSVYKEVLFRGLVFNELKESMSLSLAIFIQGLIYGLLFFNLNIPLTIYGLLGSIIFALLYIWYGSMWASIIAQIGSTGGLYVFSKLIEPYISSSMILVIASLLITLAGIYVLWEYKNRLSSKAADDSSINV